MARLAAELGSDDAATLARSGHALADLTGDADGGAALIDRALALDSNLAAVWYAAGHSRIWHGEPDDAIEHFARAMRLSPLNTEAYRVQGGTAMAHLLAGRLEVAASWAEDASRALPGFTMAISVLAASRALSGRTEEARQALERLLLIAPALRVSVLGDWMPVRRPQDIVVLADGLRRAGLPD